MRRGVRSELNPGAAMVTYFMGSCTILSTTEIGSSVGLHHKLSSIADVEALKQSVDKFMYINTDLECDNIVTLATKDIPKFFVVSRSIEQEQNRHDKKKRSQKNRSIRKKQTIQMRREAEETLVAQRNMHRDRHGILYRV